MARRQRNGADFPDEFAFQETRSEIPMPPATRGVGSCLPDAGPGILSISTG